MKRSRPFYLLLAGLLASSPCAAADEFPAAFLAKHCTHCHGDAKPKADLNLAKYHDGTDILKGRKVWESVLEKVRSGEMPPPKRPRPAKDETEAFLRGISDLFARTDREAKPDPGRVTVRRLNRAEYNNTIRDLVGVDFQPAEDFPADDVGHGFDNIGDVLTLSPILLERYLTAAESIMQRAILVGEPPKPARRPVIALFLLPRLPGMRDVPVRLLEEKGELHAPWRLHTEGDYRLRVRAWGRQVGDEPVRMVVRMDRKELDIVEVKAVKGKTGSYEFTLKLKPGEHKADFAFLNPFTDEKADKSERKKRALALERAELEGPLDTYPPTHRRLLACTGSKPPREQAREVLGRFTSAAYRRPATEAEVERLVEFFEDVRSRGESREAAFRLAMQAVLVSPKFLFRLELDDRPDSDAPHPLDDYQLASRLSYFLWSTMPDEELFGLARRKELAGNLDAQVRRMLGDPKAKALVDNFAMQWLQLRRLANFSPDAKLFPNFGERLRAAMLRETELFVASIFREDRSVLELIDADYTFLNERLASHYGIADTRGNLEGQKPNQPAGERIYGEQFRRVSVGDSGRGGLLTQASILTVTSNPTRTSPVKRGRWVLEQILGTPPPPPPPDVPELAENPKAVLSGSLRQRMEQHRANPNCAVCHARMDPIGFAFENFDAIGAFRTNDAGFTIDPSGTLPGGRTFQGPADLKKILKEKKELFTRCLTEKMLTYALGRGLEYYDRPAVDRIVAALASNDYRFSTLVSEIARSDPFRLRRGKEAK
jgi:hypothetical protein